MARIAGIEIADNLKVDYALTKIKGIGWSLSKKILDAVNVDTAKRLSQVTSEELTKITNELEKHVIEGDLIRQVRTNITRLRTISSYKGIRHTRGLPVRGQRTRHNARTKRGKRKTVGAFKKEALAKIQTAQKEKETKK
jgi:small subunit ribosomal protein S13